MTTMLTFHIITIFPEAFDSYLKTSLLKKAQERRLIKFHLVNLRDFANDKHRKVDDSPYGGGPGMVLKIEPIYKAVKFLKSRLRQGCLLRRSSFSYEGRVGGQAKFKTRVILFSTRGKKLDNKTAKRLSKYGHLILICGRYEGVDERVAKIAADEEISIGGYVLSGGELPALVLAEAVSRHIKGVLGKEESLEEIKGSYPVYTRPPIFFPEKNRRARQEVFKKKWSVPKVLLSGDHQKIKVWRLKRGQEMK